jgi:hypothetical protein
MSAELKQCSTCSNWARICLKGDTGRCYSPDREPDSEYGNLTLDSDGCKHWKKPEPEAA